MDEQQRMSAGLPTPETSRGNGEKVPTIRTMGGDVETLFQQERLKVADRIKQEAALLKQHELLETTGIDRTRLFMWILSAVVLCLGGVLAFFVLNSSGNGEDDMMPISTRPLFFVDNTETIAVAQLNAVP